MRRRGHGCSSQVSDGHDMDNCVADAAAVVERKLTWQESHLSESED